MQTDHLGSPYQLRTLQGTVVWRWETEAYGRTQPNEDPDNNGKNLTFNLRFPGQYYDRESGLHYNWHRYYSPKLGRYISADPIGVEGGKNLFGYVIGNPVLRTDPTGKMPLALPVIYVCEALAARVIAMVAGAAIVEIVKCDEQCKSDKNNDEECEKKWRLEEGLCEALALQWGRQGVRVCKNSAFTRYSECLRSGPGWVKTPLHGVDTPL